METTFQWNDRQSVKVSAMGAQHQRQFEIVRELYTAMRSGQGKDVAGGVLRPITSSCTTPETRERPRRDGCNGLFLPRSIPQKSC